MARATIAQKTARLERARLAIEQFVACGGDIRSPEAAPLGVELAYAFDDLGREFGWRLLVPTEATKKLDANHYARCPECGYKVFFFSGKDGQFMSDEKTFAHDDEISLKCPTHGAFEVEARQFIKG